MKETDGPGFREFLHKHLETFLEIFQSCVHFFVCLENYVIIRDIVEISHVTYGKLDELSVVTQPVKIIRRLDLFGPKFSGVIKEEGNGVVTKKGRASMGKNRGFMRVKSISYF